MERRKFTREFKLEAVRLIKDRGVSYAQASQDLDVHTSQLRNWVKEFCRRSAAGLSRPRPDEARAAGDRAAQARSRQAEGGAGHPKKSRGLLREGIDVKFVFIAKHRGIWPVAWLCEALGVSRGGFHAWLTRPRSRAQPRVTKSLVRRCGPASLAAIGPTAPGASGATCWRKVYRAACTGSSG